MMAFTPKMYKFKPFTLQSPKYPSAWQPRARSGHRIVCDDKYLYSIGGFNPYVEYDYVDDYIWTASKPLFKELWRFNLIARTWERYPYRNRLPVELASTAVLLFERKLIVYGGTGVPFGQSCSNRLYACDLDDESIEELPAVGDLPDPQYGQALITTNNFIYTVGGTTGYDYTCDIHRYNLKIGKWESVYICSGRNHPEPSGRYRHELAFDGRRIFVLGGGTSEVCYGLSEIPCFDLETNKWSMLSTHGDNTFQPKYPGPRRCHGAVQYLDSTTDSINVFISGGFSGSYAYNDIWRLNLKSLQWTRIVGCSFPQPLYFHSAAVTPAGKMCTFGGVVETINQTQTKRTNHVHTVWLVIPSLSEMSWEAVNYYYALRSRKKGQLFNMGIPIKFIKRLFDEWQ